MPVYNLTIPDASPIITYTGIWSDSSSADSQRSSYAESTFHATQEPGASAKLKFNGTGVYLFGALRNNHGQYSVSIDNGSPFISNGFSEDAKFQAPLFSKGDLPYGEHEVVLTNIVNGNSTFVDIDFAIITIGDGDALLASRDIVLDDSATNITYSQSWDDTPNYLANQYFSGSLHLTNLVGDFATVSFYGNAISVYGATSGNHGGYSVSVDGETPIVLNGSAPAFRPQMLLYTASGLSDGVHSLTITNQDPLFLDLDKFVISQWPSNATHSHSGTHSSNKAAQLSGGAIAGIVIGVVALLILIAIALFFRWHRRAKRQSDKLNTAEKFIVTPSRSQTASPAPSHRGAVGLTANHNSSRTPSPLGNPETDMPPPEYGQVFRDGGPSSSISSSSSGRPRQSSQVLLQLREKGIQLPS